MTASLHVKPCVTGNSSVAALLWFVWLLLAVPEAAGAKQFYSTGNVEGAVLITFSTLVAGSCLGVFICCIVRRKRNKETDVEKHLEKSGNSPEEISGLTPVPADSDQNPGIVDPSSKNDVRVGVVNERNPSETELELEENMPSRDNPSTTTKKPVSVTGSISPINKQLFSGRKSDELVKTMGHQSTLSEEKRRQRDEINCNLKHAKSFKSFLSYDGSSHSCLANDETVVTLLSNDTIGLGFNVCGNMTEGIFVRELLSRGPALESGRIHEGDRILSISISTAHMVLEDAITILSYASPYPVTLHVSKPNKSVFNQSAMTADDLHYKSMIDVCRDKTRVHPLYRSQSLNNLAEVSETDQQNRNRRASDFRLTDLDLSKPTMSPLLWSQLEDEQLHRIDSLESPATSDEIKPDSPRFHISCKAKDNTEIEQVIECPQVISTFADHDLEAPQNVHNRYEGLLKDSPPSPATKKLKEPLAQTLDYEKVIGEIGYASLAGVNPAKSGNSPDHPQGSVYLNSSDSLKELGGSENDLNETEPQRLDENDVCVVSIPKSSAMTLNNGNKQIEVHKNEATASWSPVTDTLSFLGGSQQQAEAKENTCERLSDQPTHDNKSSQSFVRRMKGLFTFGNGKSDNDAARDKKLSRKITDKSGGNNMASNATHIPLSANENNLHDLKKNKDFGTVTDNGVPQVHPFTIGTDTSNDREVIAIIHPEPKEKISTRDKAMTCDAVSKGSSEETNESETGVLCAASVQEASELSDELEQTIADFMGSGSDISRELVTEDLTTSPVFGDVTIPIAGPSTELVTYSIIEPDAVRVKRDVDAIAKPSELEEPEISDLEPVIELDFNKQLILTSVENDDVFYDGGSSASQPPSYEEYANDLMEIPSFDLDMDLAYGSAIRTNHVRSDVMSELEQSSMTEEMSRLYDEISSSMNADKEFPKGDESWEGSPELSAEFTDSTSTRKGKEVPFPVTIASNPLLPDRFSSYDRNKIHATKLILKRFPSEDGHQPNTEVKSILKKSPNYSGDNREAETARSEKRTLKIENGEETVQNRGTAEETITGTWSGQVRTKSQDPFLWNLESRDKIFHPEDTATKIEVLSALSKPRMLDGEYDGENLESQPANNDLSNPEMASRSESQSSASTTPSQIVKSLLEKLGKFGKHGDYKKHLNLERNLPEDYQRSSSDETVSGGTWEQTEINFDRDCVASDNRIHRMKRPEPSKIVILDDKGSRIVFYMKAVSTWNEDARQESKVSGKQVEDENNNVTLLA